MAIIADGTGGNPATVADIEARWRPLSDQETMNAEAFLGDAWSYLLDRRATLESDLAAGTVAQTEAVRVVCAMVLRVLKNPDGWEDESIDDWRGKRAAALASGELYATKGELAALRPSTATASRSSVRLVVYGDA